MDKIILIGAGGHAESCIDVIEQEGKYKIEGLLDTKDKIGKEILGYKIIDCDENLSKYISDKTYFLISIAGSRATSLREKIYNKLLSANAKMATVISPLAYVSKHASVDEGTIIMHQALVNANSKIGKNCIINSKALVEHDVKIGFNCHISTGAVLNGEVEVNDNSFVGSNSTVVQCVKLPQNSFVKAGSLTK